jgi:hypothetical protein
MAKHTYRIETPEGTFEVQSDTELSDAQAYAAVASQKPTKGLSQAAQSWGGSDSPGMLRQLAGGAKHGLDRMAYGVKDLFTDLTPEDQAELDAGSEFVKGTGAASSVGQFGSEALATAPIGGVIGTAAKYAGKALPMAAKAMGWGGRVVNPGLVARGAAEGAISGGVAIPGEGESRLGNMGQGAALGGVLPAAVAGVGAAPQLYRTTMSAAKAPAARRAGAVLERTLGKDKVDDLARRLPNADPTRLPQTPAALLDDPHLGSVEASARGRGQANFLDHDRDVLSRSWDTVLDDTAEASRAPMLGRRTGRIENASRDMLEGIPIAPTTGQRLSDIFVDLANSDEALAKPALSNRFREIAGTVTMDGLSANYLFKLLNELPGDSRAVQQARAALTDVGDEISEGLFSRLSATGARHGQALERATAAQNVRGAFVGPDGLPTTGPTLKVGDRTIPQVTGARLRRAIAKQDGLSPTARGDLTATTEELRKHEIYKPLSDVGSPPNELGSLKGSAVGLANVTPLWRTKGPLAVIYGRADRATQAAVDEAMLKPEKFMEIVQARQARGAPLSQIENAVLQTILGASRGSATMTAGE